jgi:hypothetical protein
VAFHNNDIICARLVHALSYLISRMTTS